MRLLFFITFLIPFLLQASQSTTAEMLKKNLILSSTEKPLINEMVSYKPIENHHFNLEAPQTCGDKGTIDKSTRVIKCQFHESGTQNITLSVCDNANTYCKNENLDVNVQPQMSKNPKVTLPPSEKTTAMQTEIKKLLLADFKKMTVTEAKATMKDKKAVLVMVSTDWCPPCNRAKEFLLPTDEFKKQTKDLLLVYVDGDNPESTEWMPVLKSYFYPTFIILNKDFESVALFTDIESHKFYNKLNLAINTLLNDPYTKLEARVNNRINGNYLQMFLDWFKSNQSIAKDQDRLLEYLEDRGEFNERIKYMKDLSLKKFKDQILLAELTELRYGKNNDDLNPEELKKKIDDLTKKALSLPYQDNDDYIINLEEFCEATQDQKTKINTPECLDYANKYNTYLEEDLKKPQDKYTDSEKILNMAINYVVFAKINKILNKKNKADQNYKQCVDEYEKLYSYTPLKEKSRSVRFQQLYCLKELDDGSKSINLIKNLITDYPYEETFYRQASKYYFNKKDYKKALEYNENALKYSYGVMWAYNMSTKAKILESLNRKKEALATLDTALNEIVLEKNSKVSFAVSMIRSQKQALEKN